MIDPFLLAESVYASSWECIVSFSASMLCLPGILFPPLFLCSFCLKTKVKLSFYCKPLLTKPEDIYSLYSEEVTVNDVHPLLSLGICSYLPLRPLSCHWSALLLISWVTAEHFPYLLYLLSLSVRAESRPRTEHCTLRSLVLADLKGRAAWGTVS